MGEITEESMISQETPVDTDGRAFQGEKARLNLWIKRELWQSLSDIAQEEDKSVTDVAKDAFRDYIRRRKSRMKG